MMCLGMVTYIISSVIKLGDEEISAIELQSDQDDAQPGVPLVGQLDVYQGAESLGGGFVLRVVEEVALAGLVGGVPVQDIESRIAGQWSSLVSRCCVVVHAEEGWPRVLARSHGSG